MHKLHELRGTLCKELEEYAKRGSNLDLQSLSTIDTLAHAIKNIDKIIRFDGEDGHSYSEGGWSSRGMRNYSYGDVKENFKKLIDNAPDEHTKAELTRMMQRFE